MFYSKVIVARSINKCIPLGDETINSSPVERGRSLMDTQPHPLLHFLVWMKPTSTNVFLQVAKKMWNPQGERSGLYGGCWSVSQPNLWSLSVTRLSVWERALSSKITIPFEQHPGRFYFVARHSTLSYQKTNHTSLLFFACLHFHCWMKTLYTTFTSRAIKKQLCWPVSFHSACPLPYRWQYWYVSTVLPAFARNMFYGGCSVFIWLPLIHQNNYHDITNITKNIYFIWNNSNFYLCHEWD